MKRHWYGNRRAIRQAIYEEQRGRCAHCKVRKPLKHLQTDHIMPLATGGADVPINWQLLCGPCNLRKNCYVHPGQQHTLFDAPLPDPKRAKHPSRVRIRKRDANDRAPLLTLDEKRAYDRKDTAQRRAKARASGICPSCLTRPVQPNYKSCEPCSVRGRQRPYDPTYKPRWRARLKQLAAN